MLSLISWNTGKKKTVFLQNAIAEVVTEQYPDIFVFQECLGAYINTILGSHYDEVPYLGGGIQRRVRIFLKKDSFQRFDIHTEFNNKLVFVYLIKNDTKEDFNIAAVHLYSKATHTERQQLWKNKPFIDKINDLERTTKRTILIGDFNYNPYDATLLDPNVFNAIDNSALISSFSGNPIGNRNHKYWYNPMWNLLGDYDFIRNQYKQASGSFFFYNEAEIPYWNLLDGALVRPGLMKKIRYDQTEILTHTSHRNFLKPLIVRPDESFIVDDFSDHLPIKITLDL